MAYTRSVVITGGTMGLGYECALRIAQTYPEYLVAICSRKDNGAADTINNTTKQKNAVFMPLDLASMKNVRSFHKTWASQNNPPIQALLLNAGLQFPYGPVKKTDEGIEATFAINHVGHALLFYLLNPNLADGARVVLTSSGTHDPAQKTGMPLAEYKSAEELAHPKPNDGKPGRQRYTSSKLCNVLWGYELDRRLGRQAPERHITVTMLDPGLMPGTGLAREATGVEKWLWLKLMPKLLGLLRALVSPNIHSPQESGVALMRLAVGEDVKGVTGKYYEGIKEIPSSKDSYDEKKSADLWKWTLEYVTNGDAAEMERFNELK